MEALMMQLAEQFAWIKMEIEININKKQIFLLAGLFLILCLVFVVAEYGGNIVTDNKVYHPLYRLAKCTDALCSVNQASVDTNVNGLIDNAEKADSCDSMTNLPSMTYSLYASSYDSPKQQRTTNLGTHKFCFLHGIQYSLPGPNNCLPGNLGCGLTFDSNKVWTLTAYAGSAGANCRAFCMG